MIGKQLAVRSAFCFLAVILASSAWAEDERRGESYDGGLPKITGVRFLQLTGGAKPRFRLAILGENLGGDLAHTQVLFDTKDPRHPVETRTVYVSPREVDVEGTASPGTVIDKVKVVVWGKPAESEPGSSISIKPAPPAPPLKEFEVKLDHQPSKEFPNLHGLVVTKVSGDGGFDANQNHMRIELEPAGVTDLKVVQSNDEQLELHFVAAADYVPKNVIVTVYDGSDLDRRQPVALAKPAPDHVEDPNAPKITSVEVVFVDRSQGNGRLRIYGKGFGETFTRPPFPVDEFLCDCLERPRLGGSRTCGRFVLDARGLKADEKEKMKARLETARAALCLASEPAWQGWKETVRARAVVDVDGRNSAIRVEKAEILDINDAMIDVYFEFTRFPHYSLPFRLASIHLTVNKSVKQTQQTVKTAEIAGEVAAAVASTYTVANAIGPKADENLTYKYTVLSKDAAQSLLGEGVADHFFVLQLSVVNNGKKKVTVPLAAIQAEVEWLRGRADSVPPGPQPVYDYLEGSATLAPIPLASVSGYFDAYEKARGRRARWFNLFDGITTLVTALIPFTGPAVKDAEVVFTAGFIPGLHKSLGDLSGQQLQNLTAMSWESTETLAAGGGSVQKLIYIQRNDQFEVSSVKLEGVAKKTTKQVSNIMDLEITGYEVTTSEAQQAAPTTAKTSTAPAEKPASPASPAAPATSPGTTPPADTPKPPASR